MHNIYLTHSEVQSLYITVILCVYPCYNSTCALTTMRLGDIASIYSWETVLLL